MKIVTPIRKDEDCCENASYVICQHCSNTGGCGTLNHINHFVCDDNDCTICWKEE